jgi:hypothetical protein
MTEKPNPSRNAGTNLLDTVLAEMADRAHGLPGIPDDELPQILTNLLEQVRAQQRYETAEAIAVGLARTGDAWAKGDIRTKLDEERRILAASVFRIAADIARSLGETGT